MKGEKAFDALNTIRNLNHVTRCQRFPLIRATSVAEHSLHVAMIALFIAEELSLDVTKVLRRALLHDAEETLLSDIPYDVKQYLPTDDALSALRAQHFGDAPEWFYNALMEPCDGSAEHHVAKLADVLELAMYCTEEIKMGNTHLKPLLSNALELVAEHPTTYNSVVAKDVLKECTKYAY